jgi:flagellar basal-body rod protein FlgF
MAGAKASMQRQDVLANNLANVSTTASAPSSRHSAPCPCRATAPARGCIRWSPRWATSDEPGPVTPTGRPLDVAMKGNAWLAVQGLDGTEAYTRAGALDVNAEGQLVTKTGSGAGRRRPDHRAGQQRAVHRHRRHCQCHRAQGRSNRHRPAQAGVARSPATLQRGTGRPVPRRRRATCTADATARLQSGALEGSNVSAVETMVAMISAARQFEQQMKLLQTRRTASEQVRGQAAVAAIGPDTVGAAVHGAARRAPPQPPPPCGRLGNSRRITASYSGHQPTLKSRPKIGLQDFEGASP